MERALIAKIVALVFALAGLAGISFGFDQDQLIEAIAIIAAGVIAIMNAVRTWRSQEPVGRGPGIVVEPREYAELKKRGLRNGLERDELVRLRERVAELEKDREGLATALQEGEKQILDLHEEMSGQLADQAREREDYCEKLRGEYARVHAKLTEAEKELEQLKFAVELKDKALQKHYAEVEALRDAHKAMAAERDMLIGRQRLPFGGPISVVVLLLVLVGLSACGQRELRMDADGVSIVSNTFGYRGEEKFTCNIFNPDGTPSAQVSLQSAGAPDEGTLSLGSQALSALERLAGGGVAQRSDPRARAAAAPIRGLSCTPYDGSLTPIVQGPVLPPPPPAPTPLVPPQPPQGPPAQEGDGGYDPLDK